MFNLHLENDTEVLNMVTYNHDKLKAGSKIGIHKMILNVDGEWDCFGKYKRRIVCVTLNEYKLFAMLRFD